MLHYTVEDYSQKNLFMLLLQSVAPRPIAFASTIDKDGIPNLAPFSFYNAFGVNPSTLIFSPSQRGRDNTTKHTLDNIKDIPEVVLNTVSFDMVYQMSLTGTEYPKQVNEFEKAGFTAIPSHIIKPFRVKESKIQYECKVRDIIETSGKPGSGNLVICEIVKIHINENIFNENGDVDPNKLDLVGRLGGNYYVRCSNNALFTIPKPMTSIGIGVDTLPEQIRNSNILTGNDLGQLGNLDKLPETDELNIIRQNPPDNTIVINKANLHRFAKQLIHKGKVYEALKILLAFEK